MQKIEKPWGHEIIWALTDKYCGKILYIKKGQRLSLQYHNIKEETILVQSGRVKILWGVLEKELSAGETIHIPPKVPHRFHALHEDCILIEVSTPELNDIIRVEDDYNRR